MERKHVVINAALPHDTVWRLFYQIRAGTLLVVTRYLYIHINYFNWIDSTVIVCPKIFSKCVVYHNETW